MDPKLAYWIGVLLNTSVVLGCALLGWREIRRGNVERHRRWMNTAVILIVLFLLSYPLKVIFLGKEQLDTWSPSAVLVLRIHETIVLVMVVAGTAARLLARRLAPGTGAPPVVRRRHRRAGRTAVVALAFVLLTATWVLAGMYLRL